MFRPCVLKPVRMITTFVLLTAASPPFARSVALRLTLKYHPPYPISERRPEGSGRGEA